ncbi:unnamed protein product [Lathyrus sativus]|nr:unnamed protein product [Lathyrus sativus]
MILASCWFVISQQHCIFQRVGGIILAILMNW